MKKPLVEEGCGSEKANQSRSNPNPPLWFAELHRLDHLQEDLALLPVGWANEKKGPMLEGWQKHLGYTIPELQATAGIRSVGTRTGISTGPLVCFDIDGETALELGYSGGMEPWAITTWQVHRDNDPFRLKILFRPTPDQIAQLPLQADGTPEFQGKKITRAAVKDANGTVIEKGEALEVFFDGGRQVILLGEHPSSGGNYLWPEGLGPEALSAPLDAWWDYAVEIANGCKQRLTSGSRPCARRNGTKRLDPCPICGRHSGPNGSGLWCEATNDGLILCMPGSTFSAEQRHGQLKIRQVVDGYALVKRTPIPEGDVLTFALHRRPRRHQRMPAQYAIAQRRRALHG